MTEEYTYRIQLEQKLESMNEKFEQKMDEMLKQIENLESEVRQLKKDTGNYDPYDWR